MTGREEPLREKFAFTLGKPRLPLQADLNRRKTKGKGITHGAKFSSSGKKRARHLLGRGSREGRRTIAGAPVGGLRGRGRAGTLGQSNGAERTPGHVEGLPQGALFVCKIAELFSVNAHF